MAYVLTPQSELEAVNEILSSIGSNPVDSLENSLDVDVLNAKRILYSVSREVQSRGWFFNTEDNITLLPDADDGLVPCPENYLQFYSKGYQLIRRNGYFYDIASQTDRFQSGLILSLIRLVPFEELPEAFKKYVTCRSARLFQMRYLGSTEIDQALYLAETEAFSAVTDYELKSGNYNIFEGDTYISGILDRS